MATKRSGSALPFLALFVAILGVMGIALWAYDRHSKARMLRLIHDLNFVASAWDVDERRGGYAQT